MTGGPLPVRAADELRSAEPSNVDPETERTARTILDAVRADGEDGLRRWAEQLGDLAPGEALVRSRAELESALEGLPAGDRQVLERTAERIAGFARAQRSCLEALELAIDGGHAGHSIAPVEHAGCYAPGGRYPLPSSVLMTAVTARVAGVDTVWVASPRPGPITLAAAAVAGADGVLAVGGAQAIGALAYGAGEVPACDVVVGPGNRFVTAAKQIIAGAVRIDMLAGPSELCVLADAGADPKLVAADLLAQAEHDPDARTILVTTDRELLDQVERELEAQLSDLPTAGVARRALAAGSATVVADLDAAIALCDRLAPEHVELLVRDPELVAARLRHYGALFVGGASAEVFGDYGAGPNHVLPTGGAARATGGLSVFTFLRIRTWLRLEDLAAATSTIDDAVRLAELEGLFGHARAAERRRHR